MAKKIAVYRAGGFDRETAWLVQSCSEESIKYEVVCFIDENEASHGIFLNGIPVISLENARAVSPSQDCYGCGHSQNALEASGKGCVCRI